MLGALVDIPFSRLVFALLPLLVIGWISHRWGGKKRELSIATFRMLVQLLLVGYFLMLVLRVDSPWPPLAIVLFMIVVSSWIAIRTVTEKRKQAYADALLAVGLGGGVIFVLVILGVIAVDPWYDPQYVIPIAGMIFANAMTAVTLCAERFEAERRTGANLESARSVAWNTALIPQVNSFLAVGLVSLPGMMTGQIIAGADPQIAARYQIMVMAMVMSSAGFAVALFLLRRTQREAASV